MRNKRKPKQRGKGRKRQSRPYRYFLAMTKLKDRTEGGNKMVKNYADQTPPDARLNDPIQQQQPMRQHPNTKSRRKTKRAANLSVDLTVVPANVELLDDTPTTSSAVVTKSPPFKKFRDDLRPRPQVSRPVLNRLNSITKPLSSSQVATRKLLRTIKRREWLHGPVKPARTNLKRRLNFAANDSGVGTGHAAKKPRAPPPLPPPAPPRKSVDTLEEGEIISDTESMVTMKINAAQSLDDDCICIDPPIEHITIHDDDEPVCSTASVVATQRKASSKLFTSTPQQKTNTSAGTSKAPELPLFFKDVSAAWFETVNSTDTFANYSPLSRLRTSAVSERRRSKRLKNMTSKGAIKEEDIIVLDETTDVDETIKPSVATEMKRPKLLSDSVIFVSESKPSSLPEFIPLQTESTERSPGTTKRNNLTPKKKPRMIANDLFTQSEKKQLNAYNNNAYNPGAGEQNLTQKRMVLIDGSNVAFNHSLNKEFSMKGLKICIDYFIMMNHEVKAIVPQYRLKKDKSTDQALLEQLHGEGKIVFTPCKSLPGKASISYDDRFLLQLACELDAAVVSNDNYRDLINENSAFKKIIENRVIGYTWCNDIFILPKDPYGRWGPSLQSILNRA